MREVACTRCSKRVELQLRSGVRVAEPCETECTIFANLPKLEAFPRFAGDARVDVQRRMREQICIDCHACSSLRHDCDRLVARDCPLSVHLFDVIEVLGRGTDAAIH
jgi:hypothetical protein